MIAMAARGQFPGPFKTGSVSAIGDRWMYSCSAVSKLPRYGVTNTTKLDVESLQQAEKLDSRTRESRLSDAYFSRHLIFKSLTLVISLRVPEKPRRNKHLRGFCPLHAWLVSGETSSDSEQRLEIVDRGLIFLPVGSPSRDEVAQHVAGSVMVIGGELVPPFETVPPSGSP
ncbi:hypothetical protein P167DRAFT_605768 [Morchella conica CCBAS932]|uniref:Uncharacterized protein n=1 Tax=Morchella conica CCBAS932 TaxID=1392247 RepID=A0A3N4KP40_9PEZI|nr:hypothetical protein P167DRAFT_605768 [Morchella conica CCBAS932]